MTFSTAIVGVLPRHSFNLETGVARNTFLEGDWNLQGNGIPVKTSLILSTNSSDRGTVLWHNYPVLSNDFEVEFIFDVIGLDRPESIGQGFAFWYVAQNASASFWEIPFSEKTRMTETGDWAGYMHSVMGQRIFMGDAKFEGVCVAFTPTVNEVTPGEGQYDPNISLMYNNGQEKKMPVQHFANESSKKVNYRNVGKLLGKIIIKPDKLEVWMQNPINKSSHDLIGSINGISLKPGGYVGFTAATGKGPKLINPGTGNVPVDYTRYRPDRIKLYTFQVTNKDPNQEGEANLPPLQKQTATTTVAPTSTGTPADLVDQMFNEGVVEKGKQDVVHTHSKHAGERKEAELLRELAAQLFKLIMESEPQRLQLRRLILNIQRRLDSMEATVEELKTEINASTGHDLDKEFDNLRRELMSLSTFAKSEGDSRIEHLKNLDQTVKTLDLGEGAANPDDMFGSIHGDAFKIVEDIDSGSKWLYILAGCCIAFICILGIMIYQKFTSWEKKHIL